MYIEWDIPPREVLTINVGISLLPADSSTWGWTSREFPCKHGDLNKYHTIPIDQKGVYFTTHTEQ